jgi:hypothetical protein
MSLGLTDVSTADLRKLLRALHREQLPCPLSPVGLTSVGLQDAVHALLSHMRGLERAAVHAVVVAVIAERGLDPEPDALDT